MIRTLLAARYALFLLVVASLAGLIVFGRHVRYEQSLESFFPDDDPAVIDYKKASSLFGNDNLIFISYDDPELLTPEGLARVAELATAVGPDRVPAVVEVQSLDRMPAFWTIDDGLIGLVSLPSFARAAATRLAKNAVDVPPTVGSELSAAKAPEALAALKAKITAHPLLQGTVVNDRGTSTAVVVRLKGMAQVDAKATIAALRDAADAFASKHKMGTPALVGPPVLLADGFTAIERDGRRLATVGMVLIGLVTLSATRSLWWAIVPILAGWTIWLGAETVLSLLGLKLSLSSGPLVAQIIVLTMPAASHLAIHFRDDSRSDRDRRSAARSTLSAVTRPILWCAVTGGIGYAALLTSNVRPVFQFGAVLAVCTVLGSLLTLAISPIAMLPPFRLEIPVEFGSTSRVGEALGRVTRKVVEHPGIVLLFVLLLVAPLALGMTRLGYESNYINAFEPEARVVRDYHSTESRLGGIGLISLVVPNEGPIDAASLAKFADLDRELAAIERDGEKAVSRTISLATVLDPDGRLLALPKAQAAEAIATKLDFVASSPQAALLNSFRNPKTGAARVLVRVSEQQEASAKKATFTQALELARDRFGDGAFVTGLSYLLNRTTEGVIATQWNTIGWSIGSILVMLTIAFRGPVLAALAILPTLLAVGLVLGLMGWIGIRLDVATALVGSVALGLSVDDTFHCLLQYRELRKTSPFRESLFASYAVTGPGVLLSSLAVAAGFGILRFSEFVPFSNFGAMVAIATLGSSVGNLVLLPACLSLGDRLRDRPAAKPLAEPAAAS